MESMSRKDFFDSMKEAKEKNKAELKEIENYDEYDDYDEDDEYDDDDGEEEIESQEVFHIIKITKEQVEKLLARGQVDVEPIEVECIDCSSEIIVYPTLILGE